MQQRIYIGNDTVFQLAAWTKPNGEADLCHSDGTEWGSGAQNHVDEQDPMHEDEMQSKDPIRLGSLEMATPEYFVKQLENLPDKL